MNINDVTKAAIPAGGFSPGETEESFVKFDANFGHSAPLLITSIGGFPERPESMSSDSCSAGIAVTKADYACIVPIVVPQVIGVITVVSNIIKSIRDLAQIRINEKSLDKLGHKSSRELVEKSLFTDCLESPEVLTEKIRLEKSTAKDKLKDSKASLHKHIHYIKRGMIRLIPGFGSGYSLAMVVDHRAEIKRQNKVLIDVIIQIPHIPTYRAYTQRYKMKKIN